MSKGATLSREEGYNFARMEGWFTTRSVMLVALTVTEIFTIEIVDLKWRKKVTFLQKIYHNTTIPVWAGKIIMKRSQIRYKGVAQKVFKKHFRFCSSREHSRWQGEGSIKISGLLWDKTHIFRSFLRSQKSLRKPRKGGLTSGRPASILKNEEIIRIQGLHQKKFKISVLRDANFARKNFSTTPQKQTKIGDNPPLGNRVVDLSNIT